MKRCVAIVTAFLFLAASAGAFALTNEEERQYGKEIYLEIARSAPINNDPYISLYLNEIRVRLESKTTMPFPVVLTVIDSPTIDAFATIGGYVYIAAGLIANCDDEEEVAGVMALHGVIHEGQIGGGAGEGAKVIEIVHERESAGARQDRKSVV